MKEIPDRHAGFPTAGCHRGPFTIFHVAAPTGAAYPGCPDPQLNDVVLWVTHADLPGCAWTLMIPENFLGTGRDERTGFRPVLGMTWVAAADSIGFENLAYHGNIELLVASRLFIERDDALRYRVTVRNPSPRPIEAVNFNACFNHRATDMFGRDVYVAGQSGWTRTGDIAGVPERDYPYFVLRDREAAWRAAGQEREHYPLHPTFKLARALSATTGLCLGLDWTLGHGSPDAALVWHNRRNPCTDLWPWIGTLAPGEERSVTGRLYFLRGANCPDRLRERFESDPW